VLAEHMHHCVAKRASPGAALAAECECDCRALGRMLDRPGQPVDDVVDPFPAAARQDVLDVFAHERPVAGLRLDAPAAP
jgi:hypothetical protein